MASYSNLPHLSGEFCIFIFFVQSSFVSIMLIVLSRVVPTLRAFANLLGRNICGFFLLGCSIFLISDLVLGIFFKSFSVSYMGFFTL